ncbi:MAG: M48 family metalloprotease [Actinomycetes bacterium]
MSPRTAALLAFAVLLVVVVVGTVVVTPWHPLGDVPAGDRVTPAVAGDFTDSQIARGESFNAAVRVPGYLALATGLLVAALLGFTPLGARLVTAVARPLGGGWVWQVLLGGLAVLLVVRLCTLPFGVWAEALRRSAGLSTRSWAGWLTDVAKGFGVNAVLTLVVLLALIGLARWLPRWWWAPAAAGAALLVVAVSFAYPLVVEPVFNRFTSMPDGALRTSLLELAKQDGVAVDDVLVADASRRTSTLNAYVSGFAGSRRIVVYDTLLQQAPDSEVRLVVAHELGHAKENDVVTGTLLGALGAALSVVVLYLLLTWQGLLETAGARSAGDPRVLACVLALIALGTFLTSPVQSLVSRHIEARADVHALNLTQDPQTFALMQKRLAVSAQSDLTPPELGYLWFGSHPTAPERIAMARTWALAHGQPAPGPLLDEASP